MSGSAVPTLLGLPLTLAAGFTDPGVADTQAASIDWGDGVVSQPGDLDAFTGATGGLTGHLAEEHAYFAPAVYTVLLHLSDDDGGLTDTSTTVRVLDARGAIVEVIAAIDLLLAGATGAERAALLAARDLLDGNLFGASVNGAVDKLDGGDLEAAALKIQQAIVALREADAVTGLDTTDLQATLALAAQSIAIQSQREAIAASIPPTSGEKRQLARIETLLVSGESFLAAGDLVRAATKFHDAVQLAESMY